MKYALEILVTSILLLFLACVSRACDPVATAGAALGAGYGQADPCAGVSVQQAPVLLQSAPVLRRSYGYGVSRSFASAFAPGYGAVGVSAFAAPAFAPGVVPVGGGGVTIINNNRTVAPRQRGRFVFRGRF